MRGKSIPSIAGTAMTSLALSMLACAGAASAQQLSAPDPMILKGQVERAAQEGDFTRAATLAGQLAAGSVDTILMIDAIHYVKDRTACAKTLLPALVPGGRLVIIDYRPNPMSARPWGPPPEPQFPREQLDREMAAAGFTVSAAYEFLPEQFFVTYVPQVTR